MALAIAKFVNLQYPDIDIRADFTNCTPFAREAWEQSDVRFGYSDGPCDLDSGHLVYNPRSHEPYLDGMVRVLNEKTELAVQVEHGVYPRWCDVVPGREVLMIGHGKRIERREKSWGKENWAQLAAILQMHDLEPSQLGGAGDASLPVRTHYLGNTFGFVASKLANCRAFIGEENGLMVLAGFLGVKQCTVYNEARRSGRVNFDRHLKIEGRMTPKDVSLHLLEWI